MVYNFEELRLDLEDANSRIEELEAQLEREEVTHSEIIESLQREKDQKIEEW